MIDLSKIEMADLRRLSIEERRRLVQLIEDSIAAEDRPDVPAEPHHMEAVLEELRDYRKDGERGRPGFEVLEDIRKNL